MMMCTRCKKRPAVVFVSPSTDMSATQGYCLVCAKELGIKPVNDIMEKMGITEDQLEAMTESMNSLMNMDDGDFLHLSLCMVLAVVFLLPRMHERYFFLADVLAAALACRDRRFVLPAALVQTASLSVYWDMGISLPAASALMLLALALTLRQGNWTCAEKDSCV